MKKLLLILVCIFVSIIFISCSKSNDKVNKKSLENPLKKTAVNVSEIDDYAPNKDIYIEGTANSEAKSLEYLDSKLRNTKSFVINSNDGHFYFCVFDNNVKSNKSINNVKQGTKLKVYGNFKNYDIRGGTNVKVSFIEILD
ncbi:hypothetical protein CLPU_3c00640 [Gottschalkia purinilytica]|uniref:Uncharacterized protein n=1 Tax=Gottschalkia purinilytica TaxID=1503 RepID=A0A0L0WCV2_GOTPU|nr:hypothetical protein [Gottschalkia purinilytica]KNF09286.1 hypothetical protein CLPU_3c00640 [Gottschalkia purinilytica]